MAVAYSEVVAMQRARDGKTVKCGFCEFTGIDSTMQPHRPLPHHYYCTTCGDVWIDREPIRMRVERQILKPYVFARFRLQYQSDIDEPAAPGMLRYERLKGELVPSPRVDGGAAVSQPEAHALARSADLELVSFVSRVYREFLTDEERKVIEHIYVERWPPEKVADKLGMAERTVYYRRFSALEQFAKAKGWMVA